jgi:hypothetical protein
MVSTYINETISIRAPTSQIPFTDLQQAIRQTDRQTDKQECNNTNMGERHEV